MLGAANVLALTDEEPLGAFAGVFVDDIGSDALRLQRGQNQIDHVFSLLSPDGCAP